MSNLKTDTPIASLEWVAAKKTYSEAPIENQKLLWEETWFKTTTYPLSISPRITEAEQISSFLIKKIPLN